MEQTTVELLFSQFRAEAANNVRITESLIYPEITRDNIVQHFDKFLSSPPIDDCVLVSRENIEKIQRLEISLLARGFSKNNAENIIRHILRQPKQPFYGSIVNITPVAIKEKKVFIGKNEPFYAKFNKKKKWKK